MVKLVQEANTTEFINVPEFLDSIFKVRLEIREFCSDFLSFFETNVLGLVLISSFTLESAVVACNPASPLSDFEYNTNKRPRSTKDTNIVGNLQNSFYTDYQCILFAYLLFRNIWTQEYQEFITDKC